MSATKNNIDTLNQMFKQFMERCVDEGGPLADYEESIEASLKEFWNDEKNQDIFKTAIKKLKGTTTSSKSKLKSKSKSNSNSKSESEGEKKRRPKSAYIFFCKETREEVVSNLIEENDGTKPKPAEVLSALGSAWKELKESSNLKDKKLLAKFEQMAVDDKKECHKENGSTEKEKKKDDGKPKRAKSAYLYFCQEKRAAVKQELEDENGEKPKPTEVTQELSRQWNALKGSKATDDKKLLAKFEQMAAGDKERYESEKESSESEKSTDDVEEIIDELKNDSSSIGYEMFTREIYAQTKEQLEENGRPSNDSSVKRKILTQWKKLSQEEKDEFNNMVI